ncbi:thiamine-phosphate kinase [Alkalibacillus salilacus]|uniref:Thiamine-monophosphate kinase n=1 Tax=Alkalibacillus salilacus TaxID=284582 RepID=A0ABT9VI25_9BACI|nr:thiamine-phosphate kinase [Alkalibacillus salilacus]MDQ0160617.1 thiamine-monophosphate kinase [Alkalibacillus salilacus]
MKEREWLQAIKPKSYRQPSVIKGFGDDGAVIKPPVGHELVIVTDAMVEDVHFSLDYMSLYEVGYRVLAANISDLIAMGSRPLYYLVSLTVPSHYQVQDMTLLYEGMGELAKEAHMDLIGGDTTGGSQLMISITAYGSVLPQYKRLRQHAKPKDIVFTTGYLGEAGYGFDLLQKNPSHSNRFANQHKQPKLRLAFTYVSENLTRLALNDISDGIATELNELAEASQVNITIEADALPIHPDMQHLSKNKQLKYALTAGEDFELVGTCSNEEWNKLEDLCNTYSIPVKRIGTVSSMTSSTPQVFLYQNNQAHLLTSSGYEHQ